MRTLAKAFVALIFIGATAIGTTATVDAQGIYPGFDPYYSDYYQNDPYYYEDPYYHPYHRRSQSYYETGWNTPNGCPPRWTMRGGICKPYGRWIGPGWGWGW